MFTVSSLLVRSGSERTTIPQQVLVFLQLAAFIKILGRQELNNSQDEIENIWAYEPAPKWQRLQLAYQKLLFKNKAPGILLYSIFNKNRILQRLETYSIPVQLYSKKTQVKLCFYYCKCFSRRMAWLQECQSVTSSWKTHLIKVCLRSAIKKSEKDKMQKAWLGPLSKLIFT